MKILAFTWLNVFIFRFFSFNSWQLTKKCIFAPNIFTSKLFEKFEKMYSSSFMAWQIQAALNSIFNNNSRDALVVFSKKE